MCRSSINKLQKNEPFLLFLKFSFAFLLTRLDYLDKVNGISFSVCLISLRILVFSFVMLVWY